jgi:hypothetical protein
MFEEAYVDLERHAESLAAEGRGKSRMGCR